uniref:60S ribosomal protein L21 n=1 Tax=Salvator merianae TaxID=96440 RepID=A0A8D0DL48_SALMN
MTNTKRKRRGSHYMFSQPIHKHGVVPLATYMCIYKKKKKKKNLVFIPCFSWGMGTKRRVYNTTQHAVDIFMYKKFKGKIFSKRINVCIEHIKHTKNRNRQKKKKDAKEKVTWFKLKCQPIPPKEEPMAKKQSCCNQFYIN